MRAKNFIPLAGLGLLLATGAARADLSFTLTPTAQSGVGTNDVIFIGTLSNTDLTTNLYLNDIQISFQDAATNYLTAETNVFFANVPGLLQPGETYSDIVFGVALSANTPLGTYNGTVTLPGGTNIFAAVNLTNLPFQVVLSAASLAVATADTNVAVSWPSPPGGFVLQQNLDLNTTNWVTITNVSAFSNNLELVILPPTNAQGFYRLLYP